MTPDELRVQELEALVVGLRSEVRAATDQVADGQAENKRLHKYIADGQAKYEAILQKIRERERNRTTAVTRRVKREATDVRYIRDCAISIMGHLTEHSYDTRR